MFIPNDIIITIIDIYFISLLEQDDIYDQGYSVYKLLNRLRIINKSFNSAIDKIIKKFTSLNLRYILFYTEFQEKYYKKWPKKFNTYNPYHFYLPKPIHKRLHFPIVVDTNIIIHKSINNTGKDDLLNDTYFKYCFTKSGFLIHCIYWSNLHIYDLSLKICKHYNIKWVAILDFDFVDNNSLNLIKASLIESSGQSHIIEVLYLSSYKNKNFVSKIEYYTIK